RSQRHQLDNAFRPEPPPEIREHEEVAVLRERLETHRPLADRPVRDAVGAAAEQDRERSRLVGGREDHGLQARPVPHRDHDFLEREGGRRRRLLRLGDGDEEHRPSLTSTSPPPLVVTMPRFITSGMRSYCQPYARAPQNPSFHTKTFFWIAPSMMRI